METGEKTDNDEKFGNNHMIMKIATYLAVGAEVVSIFWIEPSLPPAVIAAGAVTKIAGVAVFAVAVVSMKDSWRAGLAEDDRTEMITGGIYKISRNPAFLCFDCVYLGLLLMYFNWILLVISAFAMVMLHTQILQEEKYLPKVFGQDYTEYKNRVCRYIGRKR